MARAAQLFHQNATDGGRRSLSDPVRPVAKSSLDIGTTLRSFDGRNTGLAREHSLVELVVPFVRSLDLYLPRVKTNLAVAAAHHFSTHGRSTISNAQVERCCR